MEVDEAEAWKVSGKAPIGVRWVDVRKSTGEHRSRLVAQDFRPKSIGDVEGLCAAIPPIELVKLVIAAAAERCRRGYLVKVMMIDIKKAHLHAPIEGSVYVGPSARKTKAWEMRQAQVHFVRDAASRQELGGVQPDVDRRRVRGWQSDWEHFLP